MLAKHWRSGIAKHWRSAIAARWRSVTAERSLIVLIGLVLAVLGVRLSLVELVVLEVLVLRHIRVVPGVGVLVGGEREGLGVGLRVLLVPDLVLLAAVRVEHRPRQLRGSLGLGVSARHFCLELPGVRQ